MSGRTISVRLSAEDAVIVERLAAQYPIGVSTWCRAAIRREIRIAVSGSQPGPMIVSVPVVAEELAPPVVTMITQDVFMKTYPTTVYDILIQSGRTGPKVRQLIESGEVQLDDEVVEAITQDVEEPGHRIVIEGMMLNVQ